MHPLLFVLLIIFSISLAILIVQIVVHFRNRSKERHMRSICSICGQQTGVPGNKRFKLIGGCLCEQCALKIVKDKKVLDMLEKLYGPDLFISKTPLKTVEDAIRLHDSIEEIGEEQWQHLLYGSEEKKTRK